MKSIRLIVGIGAMVAGLLSPRVVVGQGSSTPATAPTPPVAVHDDSKLLEDLKNAPPAVTTLIVNFDSQRDKYLLQQHELLEKLQNAATSEERQAIRTQLQQNRQAFLNELSDFRDKLKDQLKDLRGRLSNAEILRIMQAAHHADGGPAHFHHHHGHDH